jgi:hypothetical protein
MLTQLLTFVLSKIDGMPFELDDRNDSQQEEVLNIASRLAEGNPPADVLEQLELVLIGRGETIPQLIHLAVKLARSKVIVRAVDKPLHTSFVFAMYKENTRILKQDEHPHGEDFVVRKISQLQWLFDDVATTTWSLVMVDDGCPEGSGKLATKILAERCPDAPAEVLFLEEAIGQGLQVTRPMASAAESQKGGSVVYGMWAAAQKDHDNHIIVFTDADLSTHMGQAGLLLDGIVNRNKDAAIGSRREPASVVVKKGTRNTRGKLFIYLWKGLIQPLHRLVDTQCGFKAFTSEAVREITTDMIEKKFAFDIELLLRTELHQHDSIEKVPVAWFDSEEASTTTDLQPYLPMLKQVVAFYKKYLPADTETDRLADFIGNMSDDDWATLVDNVPEPIAEGQPADFDKMRDVTVDDLIAGTKK